MILELQIGDYSSALRDYTLLTETDVGRKLAGDIEEPMTRIVTAVENGVELTQRLTSKASLRGSPSCPARR